MVRYAMLLTPVGVTYLAPLGKLVIVHKPHAYVKVWPVSDHIQHLTPTLLIELSFSFNDHIVFLDVEVRSILPPLEHLFAVAVWTPAVAYTRIELQLKGFVLIVNTG